MPRRKITLLLQQVKRKKNSLESKMFRERKKQSNMPLGLFGV